MLTRPLIVVCACLIAALGVARLVDTYPVTAPTYDERHHIGAGVEWLVAGTYRFEAQHPPLSRVAVALGPYLAGVAVFEPTGMLAVGHRVLFDRGDPVRTLALARLGNLPFFLLAAATAFFWARRIGGTAAGILGLAVLTFMPPVLAHAGVATTDMALGATVFAALFAFVLWLDRPTWLRTAGLGVAVALAVLSKLSSLLFLPVGFAGVAAVHLAAVRWRRPVVPVVGRYALRAGVAAVLMALCIWSAYRWSVGTVAELSPPPAAGAAVEAPQDDWQGLQDTVEAMTLPAPEFLMGIKEAYWHMSNGHYAYLLGETRQHGWWSFFPIGFLVKTPVPVLILMLVAAYGALARAPGFPAAGAGQVLAAFALMLLAVLPSTINIGTRHILPLFCLAAVPAAVAAAWLWQVRRARLAARGAVVALLAWYAAASLLAHPSYLSRFNALAQLTDDPILTDSDRDWGQATWALADYARANGIDRMHVAVLGFLEPDFESYDFADLRRLEAGACVTGWVAASYYFIYAIEGYAWLRALEPEIELMNAVRVYRVPDGACAEAGG